MKIKQYSELLFYIPLTLLMIADFFPDSYLSNGIVMKVNIGLLVALFVLSIVLKRSRNVDDIEKINGQIFALVYLVVLDGIVDAARRGLTIRIRVRQCCRLVCGAHLDRRNHLKKEKNESLKKERSPRGIPTKRKFSWASFCVYT